MAPDSAATPDAQLDLGEIDGPVLCFGGPYSNLQATEALLAEARRLAIPPANIICTGDVVAYCGDPAATVARIRDAGVHVVMGNCEEAIGFDADDCGCGFEDGSECQQWSVAWYADAARALDGDGKAWMRALPRRIGFTLAGRRFSVIHGGDEDISAYVFASTPDEHKADVLDRLGIDGVVAGHAGLPFTQVITDRLWHNAGVIGMPANDGTPRGWFSVLTPGRDGIAVTLHPLAYDHAGAARALGRINPTLPYARTLVDGLWPNMSVLPETERAAKGHPLAPRPVLWRRPAAVAAE